ncbi:hypothetical protein KY310_02645 [Candidatus Woesearchaeota archaeon]|nr:hypothetical protein [Candidatus Woesearchaeota archaeon]
MEYKHTEEEEDRLTEIVQEIWPPILLSLTASNLGSGIDVENLEACIEMGNSSAEEAAEITGAEHYESTNGYSKYRNYTELRVLPAAAVMIAETLLTAEKHGYKWRLIQTHDEEKAARQEVAGYESYSKYIKHVTTQQEFAATAWENRTGKKANLLSSSTMRTKPVIELEKDGTKQHLIFMESTAGSRKREATIMVFSDKRHDVFNPDFYFHEEQWAEGAEKQFRE